MKKVFIHPTAKQVFIWGLIDAFCLLSMGIILPLGVPNNILEIIGLTMVLILAVTFSISINGIIFNQLGKYDGILSVTVIQGCFLALFLVGVFRALF
ncbi:hypothetical protein ACFQ22_07010 [Lentilactobacillus raoultii]|uniref:Uncharacterized protein n=1 Tax=Lentilactobacillus raoultii TaxID=1987503 RepID=A0ABW3PP03_9LACO|nr:hypothetical protein [Lentilactobacillus raoultii]